MTGTTLMDVVRDVTDVGLRVDLQVPEHWSEIEVEGAILVVGGSLGDGEETLVPTVQVRVNQASDAESAASAVTGVRQVLPEAVVLFESVGTGALGLPETVAEVAHRSEVTGATQISMFRSIFLPDARLSVSIVATCGGAASESARDALRDIVTGVTVTSRSG